MRRIPDSIARFVQRLAAVAGVLLAACAPVHGGPAILAAAPTGE
jgi:hypothetical protein